MNSSLPICGGLLVSGLLDSQPVRAQYIVAGQVAGATYVDLAPDKVLTTNFTGAARVLDSLDLDADGRFDLRFTVASYFITPITVQVRMSVS